MKSGSFLCVVPTLGGLRSLDLILCSTGATEGIDQLWTVHTACHGLCHLPSFSRSAGSVPWAPSWSAFLFKPPTARWSVFRSRDRLNANRKATRPASQPKPQSAWRSFPRLWVQRCANHSATCPASQPKPQPPGGPPLARGLSSALTTAQQARLHAQRHRPLGGPSLARGFRTAWTTARYGRLHSQHHQPPGSPSHARGISFALTTA